MRPFDYHRAGSLSEALDRLASPGAMAIAGGTSIVDLMKLGAEAPASLVDINALPLRDIRVVGGVLSIGALASNTDVAASPLVKAHAPAVSQAILSGASGQIRNAATIGGNLLQRTRCPYFRSHDWPCNKREPGTGCPAIEGANHHHAVLGTSDRCIAVNPSDLAVALLALDAMVEVTRSGGKRTLPLAALYRLPGETPHIETVLQPGELITSIALPLTPLAELSAYVKLRARASYEFATCSIAWGMSLDAGIVREITVAIGGLGTVPWRDRQAEGRLEGTRLDEAAVDVFCNALFATARPTDDNRYKISLARRALHRALRGTPNDA